MMRGLLLLELRRSVAPWAGLLIAVAGSVMYYAGANLGGGWTGVAIQQRAMLGALWAFALAAGAAQGRRERRRRTEELINTTALQRWRRVIPTALAMALAAAAGYVGMFVAAAVHVMPVATYFPAGSLPIVAVGCISMIAAGWLGLAVGCRLPSPLTPPLLGVAGIVVLFVVPSYAFGIRFGAEPNGLLLLSPALQTTNGMVTEFSTVSARTHLIQIFWLAAIAIAALILFAAAAIPTRVTAILPAALAAVIVVPMLPLRLSDAFVTDQAAVAWTCTTDDPRICVTKVHAATLRELREPGGAALAALAAKLPGPPTSVVEDPRSVRLTPGPQTPATIQIGFEVTAAGRLAEPPRTILWGMVSGAGTRQCDAFRLDSNKITSYYTARLVAAAWLLGEPPATAPVAAYLGTADKALATETIETLHRLPPNEQARRITLLRNAELACDDSDRLAILTSGSGTR